MILSSRKTCVYMCKNPTDMRLGFNGLSALVKKHFQKNPYRGQYFAFINRRRTSCKVYVFDGSGDVVISKKLRVGVFCRPNPNHKKPLKMTATEFGQFFEGLNISGRILESNPYPNLKRKSLRFLPAYRKVSAYEGGAARVDRESQAAPKSE